MRKSAIIYKITVNGKVYVGGTTNSLSKRQSSHNYRHKYGDGSGALYKAAKEAGLEKLECVKIEIFMYDSKEEFLKRKEYWRNQLAAVLNSQRFGVNAKNHKTYGKARRDNFDAAKKKAIAKRKSDYYYKNKEVTAKCERCGSVVRKLGMAQHRGTKKCRDYDGF